jgi:hypothetical protein
MSARSPLVAVGAAAIAIDQPDPIGIDRQEISVPRSSGGV